MIWQHVWHQLSEFSMAVVQGWWQTVSPSEKSPGTWLVLECIKILMSEAQLVSLNWLNMVLVLYRTNVLKCFSSPDGHGSNSVMVYFLHRTWKKQVLSVWSNFIAFLNPFNPSIRPVQKRYATGAETTGLETTVVFGWPEVLHHATRFQEMLEKQEADRAAYFQQMRDKQSKMLAAYEAGVGNELEKKMREDEERMGAQWRDVGKLVFPQVSSPLNAFFFCWSSLCD